MEAVETWTLSVSEEDCAPAAPGRREARRKNSAVYCIGRYFTI
jgi:hypothetical protein